ncbi:hypothetical protein VIC_001528 [Vibrio coralliilyticus ATCC BAA-450]|nr:hypothetical protein VIC_001528 [Vibrio coralliilyticus ATCC BAA-450]
MANVLADHGRGKSKVAGGTAKTAMFDHVSEDLHTGEFVH